MEPHGMPKSYRRVIMTLKELNKSNSEIARTLGVSEGTVRYWHRKQREKRLDGRTRKPSGVSRYHEIVDDWVSENATRRKGWCIRIETPPGELAQVDWKEDVQFQIGAPGNWVTLVDELGYQVLDRQEVHLFFQFVSARYLKGSTIITSNRSVKDWVQVFAGDQMATTAILDRLFHRAHLFNIDGKSYRLQDVEERLEGRNQG